MIWLLATGAIVAGGAAGFVIARRYAQNTTSLLVLSAIVVVSCAVALFNALSSRDQQQAIIVLCAAFGTLTGLRFGSKVMVDLLTGNVAAPTTVAPSTDPKSLDQSE